MKLYHGRRTEYGYAVDVEEDGEVCLLHPRTDLCKLSADGLGWGSRSAEAAQLALALAADVLGDERRALKVHHRLQSGLVASLPPDEGWSLTEKDLRAAIEAIEQDRGRGR